MFRTHHQWAMYSPHLSNQAETNVKNDTVVACQWVFWLLVLGITAEPLVGGRARRNGMGWASSLGGLLQFAQRPTPWGPQYLF